MSPRSLAAALLLLALVASGCSFGDASGSGRSSVTLEQHQAAVITFTGGRYRFTWDAPECAGFFIRLAPTGGGSPVEVPVDRAAGSAEIDVPAFEATVERGAKSACSRHTVRIDKL